MKQEIVYISAEKLKPNKIIRADIESKTFDYNLDLLQNSIKAQGVLTPILVTEADDGYIIIDGNRRYFAGIKFGLKKMPCIIRKEVTKSDINKITELGFSANEMRQDLLPSEEAEALKKVCEEGQLTLEQIADATGKTINQLKKISVRKKLADEIREAMDEKKISKDVGHLLSPLPKDEQVKVVKTFKALKIPVTGRSVGLYRGQRLSPGHGISRKVVKKLKENIGILAEELDNLKRLHKNLQEEISSAHKLVKRIWKIPELNDYLRNKHPQIYKDFKSILNILGY